MRKLLSMIVLPLLAFICVVTLFSQTSGALRFVSNTGNNRRLLPACATRKIEGIRGEAMKASGTIRGKVVELEESPGLPDGQRVEVELTPVAEDPVLAAATRIRERLLLRWKKPLNLSLEWLREDRAR